ncbi:Uma2 family endonuclease [Candidatus Magnetominusculus xianensis]|uniref:Putative restriction endonuclease domain-containing protein n=1 Tax=Candidatus Magnetominusculus xianensis TaxID=1748249 RepID=A0ABR5SJB2_9BACT|nr:Uma2 family endonuclease [Candidatus Magnetominusculus xianensis]KWT94372.1 hypothetical protein ASN18_0257 [Candidatus Magnetominusculus xianensis]MBF0403978.1 Uma2 family endonuclease [Nitrospirota bacterium]
MSTVAVTWTYEKYLTLGDETRSEIIEGDLSMTPTPGFSHQHVTAGLLLILGHYIEKTGVGFIVTAPTDVILSDYNVVQPDLLFVAKNRRGIIKERGVFGPPDLVVEIISPSSHYRDVHVKTSLYERFGVAEFWIVNPFMKSIEVLLLSAERCYALFSDGCLMADGKEKVVSSVLAGLTVDLTEVFTESFIAEG